MTPGKKLIIISSTQDDDSYCDYHDEEERRGSSGGRSFNLEGRVMQPSSVKLVTALVGSCILYMEERVTL
jgi:hypothetical protein